LGPDAASRRLWSSWGDICVANDGRVYCGVGDHGDDLGGDARCFIYCWDPQRKTLAQVADMNQVVPPRRGQPAWSKVHARIDEGADGKIYFSCTLNDGNRAGNPDYKFNENLPGGQLYRYDPATGKTEVFASLPPRRCTATSILDRERNIWWCNLESGNGNALWGLDLATRKPIYQSGDGWVSFNRAFALAADGSIYFNGEKRLMKLDPQTKEITKTMSFFADSPGMRCASDPLRDGAIYGATHGTGQLFRYRPDRDELTLLGPNWLTGEYTTVMLVSPDERFLYYLPGAHGGAFRYGTPLIQYELQTGQRKVLAFLVETLESQFNYVPAGTYGAKLSANGGTLYVNFNGHAADAIRPANMKPNGFGLTAFAAIEIPESER
jgi:sugar lactone lactonase YvrE